MINEYWIDKRGGSHYHKCDCMMIKDPRFRYEKVERNHKRTKNNLFGLNRIREDGKYYIPCPVCWFRKRKLND